MRASEHAARHLLALPSWKQEELDRQARDTNYVHVHDFTMRWKQEQAHARDIEEQG